MGTNIIGTSGLININYNPLVTKFNELRFFTGITILSGLGGLGNLLEITLPAAGKLREFADGALNYSYLPMDMLVIPEGVTTFGNHSIGRSGCHLKAVDFPSTTTTFSGYILFQVSTLTTVIIRATTPPTINSNALNVIPSTAIIYVPDESVDLYKSSWSAVASRIKPLSEYTN